MIDEFKRLCIESKVRWKPSALIFGRKLTGDIIHVVCGLDEEIYFITAYEPTTEKFMDDLKTRRQR